VLAKRKVAIIKLFFDEEEFKLDVITKEYVERVLRERGILYNIPYEIEVLEE